jgi:hypothetical protein
MKKLIIVCAFLLTSVAHADFLVATHTGYYSSSNENANSTFSDLTFHLFLGKSIGGKEQFYLGLNATKATSGQEGSEFTTTEFGPRMAFYFNNEKSIYVTAAWNPMLSGQHGDNSALKLKGSSYLLGLGYELKLSSNIFLGTALFYHSVHITETEASGVTGTVDETYSTTMPVISLSVRFR